MNRAPARHDYAPYGVEVPAGVASRTNVWGVSTDVDAKYTGQLRDVETGEDYFNARYLASNLGRFMSADPGNAGADLSNPQSWHGYGYVGGQPLSAVDPSGMNETDPIGNGCFSAEYSQPCIGIPIGLGGGGSGGGGAAGGGGGSVSVPPGSSTPLPPGSFPGGETLGLPPGAGLSGPFGTTTNPFVFSLAPLPVYSTPSTLTDILALARYGPWSIVAAVLFRPTPMTAERRWELSNIRNANEDFGKRKRDIRLFYSSELGATETEDCDQEWMEAIKYCVDQNSLPAYKRDVNRAGRGNDIINCARGLVPRQCGGH